MSENRSVFVVFFDYGFADGYSEPIAVFSDSEAAVAYAKAEHPTRSTIIRELVLRAAPAHSEKGEG